MKKKTRWKSFCVGKSKRAVIRHKPRHNVCQEGRYRWRRDFGGKLIIARTAAMISMGSSARGGYRFFLRYSYIVRVGKFLFFSPLLFLLIKLLVPDAGQSTARE